MKIPLVFGAFFTLDLIFSALPIPPILCRPVVLEHTEIGYNISFLTLKIKFRPLIDLSLGKIHMAIGTKGARGSNGGQGGQGVQGIPKVFGSD